MQKVIALDGPSASGKGTIAARVAAALGWAYLDSGALYRLTALHAQNHNIDWANEAAVAALAAELPAEFRGQTVWLDGQDVTQAIRSERIGMGASAVAKLPAVRQALLQFFNRARLGGRRARHGLNRVSRSPAQNFSYRQRTNPRRTPRQTNRRAAGWRSICPNPRRHPSPRRSRPQPPRRPLAATARCQAARHLPSQHRRNRAASIGLVSRQPKGSLKIKIPRTGSQHPHG